MREGEQIVTEITACLDYLFDDGVSTVEDEQLARIAREYPDPTSQDAMAAALVAYATLGEAHVERLSRIGFDPGLLARAHEVATGLRERSAESTGSNQRLALDRRNRIATLLLARIGGVRAAARLVPMPAEWACPRSQAPGDCP